MLHRSIASVLGQTYRDFILLISDNASDDDTAGVVGSIRDPRIVYRPLQQNIGRFANFNRLVELAETEFIVLLSDDDQLHPDHLSLTLDALRHRPTVGMAHTGYVTAHTLGDPLIPPAPADHSIAFEPGSRFLERSMRSGPTVCFSSAVFRRAALVAAGGLRAEDGDVDDFPLQMRIATEWDFVYIDRPLAVLGVHAHTSSSSLGSFTPNGFRSSRALPDLLYENRRRFLAEADMPATEARRLGRIAERTHRRDVVGHLSMRATTGDRSGAVFTSLGREIRRDSRLALEPATWRFVVGQLGGRRLRDAFRGRGKRPSVPVALVDNQPRVK